MRWCIFFVLMGIANVLFAETSEDQQKRCLEAVEHMIQIAEESLSHPESRPERVEKRRVLVEDWVWRLERGEDPCVLYVDIQKAATTF